MFGQVVIGPPGSGKSTYCHGLHQFMTALNRPILIVNLDPAAPEQPYPCALSVTDLITVSDAMEAHGLGPNGAMLFCLEYLEKHIDWLEEELDKVIAEQEYPEEVVDRAYVVFDTPGQVELSTDHDSMKHILEQLMKRKKWRLASVHLVDAHHISDASKYIALLLLSLRTMLQLEMPHVNVLSKIDLLKHAGELAFNLDFYTEVQDLSRIIPLLEQDTRTAKFSELNKLICEIIEDFGLVSFETLAVEDKASMMRLVKVVDQALGYAPPHLQPAPAAGHSHDHSHEGHDHHSHDHSSSLPPLHISNLYHTSNVQERWVDMPEVYDAFERENWKQEGDKAMEAATQEELVKAKAEVDLDQMEVNERV